MHCSCSALVLGVSAVQIRPLFLVRVEQRGNHAVDEGLEKENASKPDPVLILAAASSLKALNISIRVCLTRLIGLLIYAPNGKMNFRAGGVIFQQDLL